MQKEITAKFKSKCADTGQAIKKGDPMIYDYTERKCYAKGSPTWIKAQGTAEENESRSISQMIDEQECAMFERNGYY